jgi:hypothetical protein
MAGWRMWAVAQRPAHLAEIADELGSAAEFRAPPAPNHAGTKVVVAQDTEKGIGVHLCDIVNHTKKLVYEEEQQNYFVPRFGLFSWSPDDSFFAYTRQTEPKVWTGVLVICDGTTGSNVSVIPAGHFISQLAWLSHDGFAYLTDTQDLLVYNRNARGRWIQTQYITNATSGKDNEAQGFTAVSTNQIAWRLGNGLFTLEFGSNNVPVKIWESTNASVLDSFYSSDVGKFLLTCKRENERIFEVFDPANKSLTELGRTGCPPADSITKAALINQGNGYSYLSNRAGMYTCYVKTNVSAETVSVLGQYEIRYCAASGETLYLAGSSENEPRGIWKYQIASKSLQCVVPASDRDFQYTRFITPVCGLVTNASGIEWNYNVWPPAHVSPGKKYPIILGATPYSWTPYPQAAANAGYYFATVNRPGWGEESLKDWSERVMCLYYETVAKLPSIDTNRVFLYARSGETTKMYGLISQKPKLWKGTVIFDPGSPPPLSSPYLTKILIVAGADDGDATFWLPQTQEKAAESGIQIWLYFLLHSAHDSFGTAVQQVRVRHLVDFLSGD